MFCVILRSIALVVRISNRHCEENYKVIDEAISGYLARLSHSLRLLAMTMKPSHAIKSMAARNDRIIYPRGQYLQGNSIKNSISPLKADSQESD